MYWFQVNLIDNQNLQHQTGPNLLIVNDPSGMYVGWCMQLNWIDPLIKQNKHVWIQIIGFVTAKLHLEIKQVLSVLSGKQQDNFKHCCLTKWVNVAFFTWCCVCFSSTVFPFFPQKSPADRCKKIHAGDEVIQVNHQTVVRVTKGLDGILVEGRICFDSEIWGPAYNNWSVLNLHSLKALAINQWMVGARLHL